MMQRAVDTPVLVGAAEQRGLNSWSRWPCRVRRRCGADVDAGRPAGATPEPWWHPPSRAVGLRQVDSP